MSETRSLAFASQSVPAAYARNLTPVVFEPWARKLIERARLRPAIAVLDVACGPGTVARLAAERVGESGKVVGCDISEPMLAVAAAIHAAPGAAPVSYLACPAEAIAVEDSSFQAVLCQQGVQFFPDRLAGLREMRRALEPGAAMHVAVWASERPLGLFGSIMEAVAASGLAEPFPRAFDAASYGLPASELQQLLEGAQMREISLETVELECVFSAGEDAVAAIGGTPFGPLVAQLPDAARERIGADLLRRLDADAGGQVRVTMTSHIAAAVR